LGEASEEGTRRTQAGRTKEIPGEEVSRYRPKALRESFRETRQQAEEARKMRLVRAVIVSAFLMVAPVPQAQSDSASSVANPSPERPSELEQQFLGVIRNGDALKLLSYVPEDGVHLGHHADHVTRTEIEEQLTNRKGLYCKLFDSTCLRANAEKDAGQPLCSYRELLTSSDKVRTASTETTRNNVRQAILIAEIQSDKCGGHLLIDFIFNQQNGGWKLFSIP